MAWDGIRDHQVELKPPLGGISSFGGGHRYAWCWQILLQKSKIEELQISRKSTLRCFRCCAVLVGSIRRPVVDRVRNDVLPHVAACRTHEPEKFQRSVKTDFFNTIEGRVDLVLTGPKGRLWRNADIRNAYSAAKCRNRKSPYGVRVAHFTITEHSAGCPRQFPAPARWRRERGFDQ